MGEPITTGALIAGGAALGSAAIGANAADKNKPQPTKTVANPNFDAIIARYMSIMDKYMAEHGIAIPTTPIKPLYPAPGSTPEAAPSTEAVAPPATPQSAMASRMPGIKSAEVQAPVDPSATSNAPVYGGLISGAAQLGGALIKSGGGGGSGRQPTVDNPYYQPIQDRYMAIFDDFLTRKGYGTPPPMPAASSAAPAPEAAPPAAPPSKPTSLLASQPQSALAQQPQRVTGAPISEGEYQDASLAAKLGARRLGLNDAPALPTTRDFHERDQATKQEELNRLYQYVYGQRMNPRAIGA